jgi:hypothetical protein
MKLQNVMRRYVGEGIGENPVPPKQGEFNEPDFIDTNS